MKVSFDIKLTAKDLYKFNIMQAYKGMQGFLSILLPVLVFAYAATSFGQVSIGSTLVYVGLGILFLGLRAGGMEWFSLGRLFGTNDCIW